MKATSSRRTVDRTRRALGLLTLFGALGLGCSTEEDDARAAFELVGPAVGVVNATTKIRPFDFNAPVTASASIDAAQNEFEPFQIAVAGGPSGISNVQATAVALKGPNGAEIPASNVRLYQVGLYKVAYASNVEGAAGQWPDPLIPDVDRYDGQKRKAFPFSVAPNETRAIWVDVFVPKGQAPGSYAGSVTVTGTGLGTSVVPVSLRVRGFGLPSTATLKSAFGFSVDECCRAHNGTTWCSVNADADAWNRKYARAALDHRISLYSPYYTMPSNDDWTYFDGLDGPLLDGTAPTALKGAKQTSFRSDNRNATFMAQEKAHFDAKGWSDRLFDYTCDEPPITCTWGDIASRANAVHAAGLRTLVTTDVDAANKNLSGWQKYIDIMVPVVNYMDGSSGNKRSAYDPFLAQGSKKELWWYQSCMSHGCGGGCYSGQQYDGPKGYPSYTIDSSAMQNRAMEWLSYEYDVSGELYYETVQHLNKGWDSQSNPTGAYCDFSGNGDGSLFYPGTPARIGGSTGIPVESVRLKMIREGMEDYEYLHLLESLGDPTFAMAQAKAVFPNSYSVTKASPETLYAARKKLADRIEELLGVGQATPPPAPTPTPAPSTLRPRLAVNRAKAPVDLAGDLSEFDTTAALVVEAGNATATFRLLWDASYLYVSAKVSDPDVRYEGSGHDGPLYDADAIELMLDPEHDQTPLPDADDRQLIVTAKGDVYDAKGSGSSGDKSFDFAGLVAKAVVTGTFNDAAPDGGYRIAVAIPWSSVPVTSPGVGLVLGADLALDNLSSSGLAFADWANLNPFAQPKLWNELELVDTSTRLPVSRTKVAVNLGGDLSEFGGATPVVVAAGGATATFRLLWDPQHLYVSAKVADADLRFVGSGDDGPLWNADAIEILLDPRRDKLTPPNHEDDRQLIITAKGDLYDAAGSGSTGDGSFDFNGLSRKVLASGSFNDTAADKGYQVAVAIPWSGLPLAAGKSVGPGLVLGADLALDNLQGTSLAVKDWASINPFAQPSLWKELELRDAP